MPVVTDGVVGVLLFYYFVTGWRKSFLRSLLGPVSFLLCVYAAWAYFQKTHHIGISFAISFFGPFVINFLGSGLIRLIGESDATGPKAAALLARALGATLNLLWGGAMVVLMILLFALSPANLFQTEKIKQDVLASRTFALIAQRLEGYLPRITTTPPARVAGKDEPGGESPPFSAAPTAMPLPQEVLPEARAILEDERVQALIADPEVQRLIEEKNYMQLLNNPRFQKILEDPQLVMKFLEIQRKMGGQLTLPGTGNPDSRASGDQE